jgi:hypothetical protein
MLALLGLFALVPLLALVPAAPAAAHDGKINLAVAGDGATGVTVRATYADGHALDVVLRLVLTATADGGRSVGPIQLNPANEGQGFYASGQVLTPGRWQVRVTAPRPNPADVLVVVDARAAQAAPPPVARPVEQPQSGDTRWQWWVAGIALAIAAAAGGTLLALRRRPR